jgi:trigger factor
VEKKIRERKEKAQKSANEAAAVRAALKNAKMDIPDAMVEEQAQRLVDEFAQQIQSQGMNMQQYMQITGMNDEMLEQQMRPQALERIQNSLLQDDLPITEVQTAGENADDRHDDVVNNGSGDLTESTADDNTDSQVNHIAAHGKGFELVQELFHFV